MKPILAEQSAPAAATAVVSAASVVSAAAGVVTTGAGVVAAAAGVVAAAADVVAAVLASDPHAVAARASTASGANRILLDMFLP